MSHEIGAPLRGVELRRGECARVFRFLFGVGSEALLTSCGVKCLDEPTQEMVFSDRSFSDKTIEELLDGFLEQVVCALVMRPWLDTSACCSEVIERGEKRQKNHLLAACRVLVLKNLLPSRDLREHEALCRLQRGQLGGERVVGIVLRRSWHLLECRHSEE